MADGAAQRITPPEKVVFDGQRDLLEYDTVGVQDLQDLEHVDVLVEDALRDNSGYE